jgi:hypothetical protein
MAYWKDLERRHAKRFWNGKRIVRGDNFSASLPDGESPFDVFDAKCRQTLSVVTMFRESEKKYREYTGDRRFHLVLHEKARPGDFVLVRAEDYADLVKKEGRLMLLEEFLSENKQLHGLKELEEWL